LPVTIVLTGASGFLGLPTLVCTRPADVTDELWHSAGDTTQAGILISEVRP
jgi:hypothetical protein